MKTPEQLKGAIRNIAKQKDLHAQEVLRKYLIYTISGDPVKCIPPYESWTFHGTSLLPLQEHQGP